MWCLLWKGKQFPASHCRERKPHSSAPQSIVVCSVGGDCCWGVCLSAALLKLWGAVLWLSVAVGAHSCCTGVGVETQPVRGPHVGVGCLPLVVLLACLSTSGSCYCSCVVTSRKGRSHSLYRDCHLLLRTWVDKTLWAVVLSRGREPLVCRVSGRRCASFCFVVMQITLLLKYICQG